MIYIRKARARIWLAGATTSLSAVCYVSELAQAATIGELSVIYQDPLLAEVIVCNPGPHGSDFSVGVTSGELLSAEDNRLFMNNLRTSFAVHNEAVGLISIFAEGPIPEGVSLTVTLFDKNGESLGSAVFNSTFAVRDASGKLGCVAPAENKTVAHDAKDIDFVVELASNDTWRNLAETVNAAWYGGHYPVEQVMLALYRYNSHEPQNLMPGAIYSLPDQLYIPAESYTKGIAPSEVSLASYLDTSVSSRIHSTEDKRNSTKTDQDFSALRERLDLQQEQLRDLQKLINLEDPVTDPVTEQQYDSGQGYSAPRIGQFSIISREPLIAEAAVCNLGDGSSSYVVRVATDEAPNVHGRTNVTAHLQTSFIRNSDTEGLIRVSSNESAPQGISLIVSLLDESGDLVDSLPLNDFSASGTVPGYSSCTDPVGAVLNEDNDGIEFVIDIVKGDTWRNIAEMVNLAWYQSDYDVEQVMLALYKYNNNGFLKLSSDASYPVPDKLSIPVESYPASIAKDELMLVSYLDAPSRTAVSKLYARSEFKQMRQELAELQEHTTLISEELFDSRELAMSVGHEVSPSKTNFVTGEKYSVIPKIGVFSIISREPLIAEAGVCNLGIHNLSVRVVTDEEQTADGRMLFTEKLQASLVRHDDSEGVIRVSSEEAAPYGVSIIVELLDQNGESMDSVLFNALSAREDIPGSYCTEPVTDLLPEEYAGTEFVVDIVAGDTWRNMADTVNIAWYHNNYTVGQVMLALYKYNNHESLEFSPGYDYSLPRQLFIPDESYPAGISQDEFSLASYLDGSARSMANINRPDDMPKLEKLKEELTSLQGRIELFKERLLYSVTLEIKPKAEDVEKRPKIPVDTIPNINSLETPDLANIYYSDQI